MHSSFRKPAAFLALVVIVVSSWGIYHGVRMGVADGVAYKAKYAVKTWEQDNRLPTAEEAAYALQQAASALAWQPENPEYMALKARVLTYQGLLYWGEDRFFEITEEAVTLYHESTRRRPKWPYSWSGLALVKAYRAEFDDVYKEAVAKAVKFGPWEPGVHRTLALAGLTGWARLDKATRGHIVANIHRGLRFSSGALAELAQRYKKRDQLCALLPNDQHSQRFCGR